MSSTKSDSVETLTGGDGEPEPALPKITQGSSDSWDGRAHPGDQGDPLVGTTLHETYTVVRIIGEGGMGRVYEARHTRIENKRFALKVLHAEYAANPELQMRFQREAEAAAAIEHPGVVGTYDIGHTPQGSPYMVSEYLDGRDLHSYINEYGPLEQALVVNIGMQLCTALAAAHARNVIHRDMKPHNVFVLGVHHGPLPTQVEVKLLDFGLSRFVDGDSQLTKTGVVLGTPGYMSPEQAQGHETTQLTDIYGIGAILYAASTGRAPFKEKSPQLTVLSVMHKEPLRPRAVVPEISPALELIIQKAMARTPSERYESPRALRDALNDLASTELNGHGAAGLNRAGAARLRLFLWVLAALFVLILWTSSAFLGALTLRGIVIHPRVETRALVGLVSAAALLPALLVWRQLRRNVWNNTPKVVAFIEQARGPVVVGLFAYGAAALVVRLTTQALSLGTGAPSMLGAWPGWDLALAMLGALAASTAALKAQRWRAWYARWIGGAWGTAMGVGLSIGILAFGLKLASHSAATAAWAPPIAAVAPSGTVAPPSEAPSAPSPEPAATVAESTLPPPTPPLSDAGKVSDGGATAQVVELAPRSILTAAVAEGAATLEELSRSYPGDPEVLNALVFAYASRAASLPSAVDAIRRLLRVAPDFETHADIRVILTKALLTEGPAETAAANVVRHMSGTLGGDILYDLLLRHPEQRTPLNRHFLVLRRAGKVSDAAAVAYDLRFAASCRARLKYLDMATTSGDLRSASVLSSLVSKPAKCPARQTCGPQCPNERAALSAALRGIQERYKQENAAGEEE